MVAVSGRMMAKLPRNYRISSEVDQLLKFESARLTDEQGKKVSEADVIEMAVVKWCSEDGVNTPVNTAPRLTDSFPGEIEQRILREEQEILSEGSLFDRRPKNAFCKHCGSRFAGVKYATICPECKSSGHTLTPSECPVCNEGRAI